MVKFEKVLDGAAKFMDKEIYPGMNDWQEVLVRIAVGRIFENREVIKNTLVNNGIVRTFGVIDEDGNVDIEGLAEDLKTEIKKKTKITVEIPMFGSMTFHPSDVDKLCKFIMEGKENEDSEAD